MFGFFFSVKFYLYMYMYIIRIGYICRNNKNCKFNLKID